MYPAPQGIIVETTTLGKMHNATSKLALWNGGLPCFQKLSAAFMTTLFLWVICSGPEVLLAERIPVINGGDRLQGACMFIRHKSIQTYCQISKPLQCRL